MYKPELALPTSPRAPRNVRVAWMDAAAPPVWLKEWFSESEACHWSGSFEASRRGLMRLTAAAPDLVVVGGDAASELDLGWVRRIKLMIPSAQILLVGGVEAPREAIMAECGTARASARLGLACRLSASCAKRTQSAASSLTEREREVLALLAQGARYKEIADALGLTYNTVHTHLRRAFKKLQVRSATQAALKFLSLTER